MGTFVVWSPTFLLKSSYVLSYRSEMTRGHPVNDDRNVQFWVLNYPFNTFLTKIETIFSTCNAKFSLGHETTPLCGFQAKCLRRTGATAAQ